MGIISEGDRTWIHPVVLARKKSIADMDVGWIHPWVGLDWVGLGRKFSRFGGLGWVGFIYAHGNFFVNLTIYIYLSHS